MAYYHVTNEKILEALTDVWKQLKNQRKICKEVLLELGCEKCHMSNAGLHGIVAENRKDFPSSIWCMLDPKKYGRNVLRPAKSDKAAARARGLFYSVPKIDLSGYIASLKMPFPLLSATTGQAIFHPGFQKAGKESVLSMPDWAVTFLKVINEVFFPFSVLFDSTYILLLNKFPLTSGYP